MDLKNGYKTLYETAEHGGEHLNRIFTASKTGLSKDAEFITNETIDRYKLVYEADGHVYKSTSGIPTAGDDEITPLRHVLEEGYVEKPGENTSN